MCQNVVDSTKAYKCTQIKIMVTWPIEHALIRCGKCFHPPYGRKFWRGIYFGGLAVLRSIRQYFIRQNFCDIMLLRVLGCSRCASLILGMEFTIESCVRGHQFSKEFCTSEVGEEFACLSTRGKAIQMTCTRSL